MSHPSYKNRRTAQSYAIGTKKMVETRKRLGNFKWTDEARRKASLSHRGKKQPWSRDNIIRLMATGRIKKFDTKPELAMKEMLKAWGFEYEFQKIIHGIICDFYIPSKRAIVFVDGEYWHNYPYGTEKDRSQDAKLRDAGYAVKRFWGKNILKNQVHVGLYYFLSSLVTHA